jgi:hypothetical protein
MIPVKKMFDWGNLGKSKMPLSNESLIFRDSKYSYNPSSSVSDSSQFSNEDGEYLKRANQSIFASYLQMSKELSDLSIQENKTLLGISKYGTID